MDGLIVVRENSLPVGGWGLQDRMSGMSLNVLRLS